MPGVCSPGRVAGFGHLTHGLEKLAAGVSGPGFLPEASRRPRYCRPSPASKPKKSGVYTRRRPGDGLALVEQVGEGEVHGRGELPYVLRESSG